MRLRKPSRSTRPLEWSPREALTYRPYRSGRYRGGWRRTPPPNARSATGFSLVRSSPAAWHGRSGFSGRSAGVGSGILVGIVAGGWVAAPLLTVGAMAVGGCGAVGKVRHLAMPSPVHRRLSEAAVDPGSYRDVAARVGSGRAAPTRGPRRQRLARRPVRWKADWLSAGAGPENRSCDCCAGIPSFSRCYAPV